MRTLTLILCFFSISLFCENKDSVNLNVIEIKDGYLSKIEIWSPYKVFYFYVYSKNKIDKLNFRITTDKKFIILDSTVNYIYINDMYPKEISQLKSTPSIIEWEKKISIFKRYKKSWKISLVGY